jgi:hypothetical protein
MSFPTWNKAGRGCKGGTGTYAPRKTGTAELRKAVKHIKGAWIRNNGNGTAWAGYDSTKTFEMSRREGTEAVRKALEGAGYGTAMNGAPGTEGELIIDVTLPSTCSSRTRGRRSTL